MSKLETSFKMLGAICPMHLVLDDKGQIVMAGPTLRKISPIALIRQDFLTVFEIKRPRNICELDELRTCNGSKLTLQFRCSPYRQLRGFTVRGPQEGFLTINLSFGIGVVDAVSQYGLTAADFAPTDLAVEMLYLVEAKSAAMNATRQLNERLQKARETAEDLARTDTLTGLMNRRAMDQKLNAMISSGEPFSLMHIDLDYFKSVNDTMGHAAGDAVLQKVAKVMKSSVREFDTVSRVGGDEFVILLNGALDRSALMGIGQQIIAGIKEPVAFEKGQCSVSCSIGIASTSAYVTPDADTILRDADTALYAAKRMGRERCLHSAPSN